MRPRLQGRTSDTICRMDVARTYYKPWVGSPRVKELYRKCGIDVSDFVISTYSKEAEQVAVQPFAKPPEDCVDEKIFAAVLKVMDRHFPTKILDEKICIETAVKSVSLQKGVGHPESNTCKNRQEALEKYLWWYKYCVNNEKIQPMVHTDREYWSVETYARVMMKEECRETQKVVANDVRAIMPCAMLLYLVENMLFDPIGSYMAKCQKGYHRYYSRYNGGWNDLFCGLRKYSRSGDVKKFDKSSTPGLHSRWFAWQEKFFSRAYHKILMRWVLTQLLFSPLILQNGEIFKRVRGLISGMFGTSHHGTGCVYILICYALVWNLLKQGMALEDAIEDVCEEKTYLWKNTGDNVIVSSDSKEKMEILDIDTPLKHWSTSYKQGPVVETRPKIGERGGPEFLGDFTYNHPCFGFVPYPSQPRKILAALQMAAQSDHVLMDLMRAQDVHRGAFFSEDVRPVCEMIIRDILENHRNLLNMDIIPIKGGKSTTCEMVTPMMQPGEIYRLYTGYESAGVLKSQPAFEKMEHVRNIALNVIGKAMPTYGNWGGPGTDVLAAKPPIDALDAAFKEHDLGYEVHDHELADKVVAKRIADMEKSGVLRGKYAQAYARAAKLFFGRHGYATDAEVAQLQRDIEPFERVVPVDQKHTPVLKNDVRTMPGKQIVRFQNNKAKLAKGRGVARKISNFAQRIVKRKAKRKQKQKAFVRREPAMGRPGPRIEAPVQAAVVPRPLGGAGRGNRGSLLFILDDRVVDASPQAGGTTLNNGQLLMNVKFNPANFPNTPRMKIQSQLYARYQVRKLWMEITPCQTSGAIGQWEAYWDPDPNDDPTIVPAEQRVAVATNHKNSKGGVWWGGRTYRIDAPTKRDHLYMDPNEDEVLYNTAYRFVMVSTASAGLTAASVLFSAVVKGEIYMWDQTVEPIYSGGDSQIDANIFSGGALTAGVPFGPTPTFINGTANFSIGGPNSVATPGQVLYLPSATSIFGIGPFAQAHRYAYFGRVTGTVISAVSVTGNGSHTVVTAIILSINGAATEATFYGVIQVGAASGTLINNNISVTTTATTIASASVHFCSVSAGVTKKTKLTKAIDEKTERSFLRMLEDKQFRAKLRDKLNEETDEKEPGEYVSVEQISPANPSRRPNGILSSRVQDFVRDYDLKVLEQTRRV